MERRRPCGPGSSLTPSWIHSYRIYVYSSSITLSCWLSMLWFYGVDLFCANIIYFISEDGVSLALRFLSKFCLYKGIGGKYNLIWIGCVISHTDCKAAWGKFVILACINQISLPWPSAGVEHVCLVTTAAEVMGAVFHLRYCICLVSSLQLSHLSGIRLVLD